MPLSLYTFLDPAGGAAVRNCKSLSSLGVDLGGNVGVKQANDGDEKGRHGMDFKDLDVQMRNMEYLSFLMAMSS